MNLIVKCYQINFTEQLYWLNDLKTVDLPDKKKQFMHIDTMHWHYTCVN